MTNWKPNSGTSRRNFLRGTGVALALPWMESLPAFAQQSGVNQPPLRFATIYFSNGVEPEHWWAKGSGAAMEIGPGLAPIGVASDHERADHADGRRAPCSDGPPPPHLVAVPGHAAAFPLSPKV